MTSDQPGDHTSADDAVAAFIELVEALVTKESPSRDEGRLKEVAHFAVAQLEQRGATVERVVVPGYGEHLIGRIGEGEKPLLLLGHMDTVHPVGTLERLPFHREDGRLYGPGVYDMKGGIAVMWLALDRLAAAGRSPNSPITILLTCDEEIGSLTSRALIEREAARSAATLVLEPSLPGGKVKVARKGVAAYEVTVSGVPAHAGIEPEKGASAVHELVRALGTVLASAEPERGTTINVGTIHGGTTTNVVAEQARAMVDVRFWERSEADRIDALVRSLAVADDRCQLTVNGGVNRYPLEETEASRALLARARVLAPEGGDLVETGRTGGASDGNFASAVGCPTLDGLGPDGVGAHTLQEHVLLADVPGRIEWISRLIEVL